MSAYVHDSHGHEPAHRFVGQDDHHRGLDLDAVVFSDHLTAALDLAGSPSARNIVDLGAGTGAGSRLLRERYPDAALTCVDHDRQMLEVLRQQGFTVVPADLDNGFPLQSVQSVTAQAGSDDSVDMVWASSSLHHVSHPNILLSGIRRALASDGVLIVVELADLPSFLHHLAQRQLEERCHTAARREGWNQHPDWGPIIESTGFTVTKAEFTTTAPVTAQAQEYAHQWLSRFTRLATLADADRQALHDILTRGLDHAQLQPRATRTIWTGRPTQDQTHPLPAP
jgi:trans-aconitate methyltransferase